MSNIYKNFGNLDLSPLSNRATSLKQNDFSKETLKESKCTNELKNDEKKKPPSAHKINFEKCFIHNQANDPCFGLIPANNFYQMELFLNQPLEQDISLKCEIIRTNEQKIIKYFLYTDSNLFLLSALKNKSKNYNHYIYMNENITSAKDKNYLGKLSSNFIGTNFNLYDNGKKPKKNIEQEWFRINLCGISYVNIYNN